MLEQHRRRCRAKFGQVVAALNTQAAGRSLFAGAATDTAALADAETILAT